MVVCHSGAGKTLSKFSDPATDTPTRTEESREQRSEISARRIAPSASLFASEHPFQFIILPQIIDN